MIAPTEFYISKVDFLTKKWGFIKKTPIIGHFTLPGALFKSGIAMKQMQYMFVLILFVTRLKVPFLESIMVAVIRIAGIHTTHVILNILIIMIVLVTIS